MAGCGQTNMQWPTRILNNEVVKGYRFHYSIFLVGYWIFNTDRWVIGIRSGNKKKDSRMSPLTFEHVFFINQTGNGLHKIGILKTEWFQAENWQIRCHHPWPDWSGLTISALFWPNKGIPLLFFVRSDLCWWFYVCTSIEYWQIHVANDSILRSEWSELSFIYEMMIIHVLALVSLTPYIPGPYHNLVTLKTRK